MLSIALFEPEIPPNTGNIARLCVGLNANLIIIGKPSFDISEKAVRRAGLDYWKFLKLSMHDNWEDFVSSRHQTKRIFLLTKFGKTCYTKEKFQSGDCFVFGKETSGLPESIHRAIPNERHLYIPIPGDVRSLNLSNAVAVVAYEVFRQLQV